MISKPFANLIEATNGNIEFAEFVFCEAD